MNTETPEPPNPSGKCLCGCGKATSVAKETRTAQGWVKGEHVKYVRGHDRHTGSGETERIDESDLTASDIENIWQKMVSRFTRHENGCWVWQCGTRGGYGRVWYRGRDWDTHRISYLYHHGRLGDAYACHSCDNRRCVNPGHIWEGDHEQNMRDMAEKGHSNRGVKNHFAKLTPAEVKEIRQRYREEGIIQKDLAAEYDIARSQISLIVNRHIWSHVA